MRALERTISDIAPTNMSILIIGESGTGKQALARHIHSLSLRRNEPFTKVICGSASAEIPASYFKAPASDHWQSNLQRAGSLFLAEIGELDFVGQRNFLYAIPDNGDETPNTPRLLSSTSRSLEDEIRAGRFRAELYFRLNGASLRIPPLRQRKQDIAALLEFFLEKHAVLLGKPRPTISAEMTDLLVAYNWPGNIRELENAAKKIVVLGNAEIALADFATVAAELENPSSAKPGGIRPVTASPLKQAARAASHRAERQLILEALARTRWNRKRAAQELKISYKSLLYKLKQIGAEEPELT